VSQKTPQVGNGIAAIILNDTWKKTANERCLPVSVVVKSTMCSLYQTRLSVQTWVSAVHVNAMDSNFSSVLVEHLQQYFVLKELFQNVDATTIVNFINEINFYHLV